MAMLHVEKLGGLAGFGGKHARIRSRGQIDSGALSGADQHAVESLFRAGGAPAAAHAADGFRFRISRATGAGTETIEVAESSVPAAIASCVRDELV